MRENGKYLYSPHGNRNNTVTKYNNEVKYEIYERKTQTKAEENERRKKINEKCLDKNQNENECKVSKLRKCFPKKLKSREAKSETQTLFSFLSS